MILLPTSPSNWDYRFVATHPACLLRLGLYNFLPGLASNLDPPYHHLPSTWDYQVHAQPLQWHFNHTSLMCSSSNLQPSQAVLPHSSRTFSHQAVRLPISLVFQAHTFFLNKMFLELKESKRSTVHFSLWIKLSMLPNQFHHFRCQNILFRTVLFNPHSVLSILFLTPKSRILLSVWRYQTEKVYILRWKGHPLKWRGFPVVGPMPFSPVHNARKFSAVLGTISANNSKTILPTKRKENEILLVCKTTRQMEG